MPIKTFITIRFAWSAFLLAMVGVERSSFAQGVPAPDIQIELTVHPAAAPVPALKYRFLPGYLDRRAGNAAPVYCKAFLVMQSKKLDEKVLEWLGETPLDKLPTKEVREVIQRYDYLYELIDIAATRDQCVWDPPVRESGNVFSMLLPEATASRSLARLLALKARLQIAEGHLVEAQKTIRTMYTVARHVSEQPFLISRLVGFVIAEIATQRVEELIQADDAPNLYWALTDLPNPIIDLRGGFEYEYAALILFLPELRNVQTADYADEQWDRLLAKLRGRLKDVAALGSNDDPLIDAIAQKQREGDKGYQDAAGRLIERGAAPKTVAKMPKSRVILIDIAQSYAEVCDEMFKGAGLPFAQAAKVYKEGEEAVKRARSRGLGGQLAALLLPAVSAASLNAARIQREIEVLRTIEAIRMHAAKHGELPGKLADIDAVPLPDNPVTGKPFGYRLEKGVATIEVDGPSHYPKRYRIRLAK